jgi:hypothetical protein
MEDVDSEAVLEDAFQALRAAFGRSIEPIARDGAVLGIAVAGERRGGARLSRSSEPPLVVVTVLDPARPSFRVTYPAVLSGAMSRREEREVSAEHVLPAALFWIVRAVVRQGAVLPELCHARVLARRAGHARRAGGQRRQRLADESIEARLCR